MLCTPVVAQPNWLISHFWSEGQSPLFLLKPSYLETQEQLQRLEESTNNNSQTRPSSFVPRPLQEVGAFQLPTASKPEGNIYIFNFNQGGTEGGTPVHPVPAQTPQPTPTSKPEQTLPLKPEIQSFLYELLYIPFIPVNLNRSLIALQAVSGRVVKQTSEAEPWKRVRSGDLILVNNQVKTGDDSSVIMEFPEELGYARLFSQTDLAIRDVSILPSLEGEQVMRFEIGVGRALFKIREFTRRRSMLAIHTPGVEVFVTGIKLFPPYKKRPVVNIPKPSPPPPHSNGGQRVIIDENGRVLIQENSVIMPEESTHGSAPPMYPLRGTTINSDISLRPYLADLFVEPEKDDLFDGIEPSSVFNTNIEKIVLDPGATFMITVSTGGATSVTVAEGDVLVRSRGQALAVHAGEVIRVIPGEPPTIAKGVLRKEELNMIIGKVEAEGENVVIQGSTDRAASVTVNGKPVTVDTQGQFIIRETLQPGVTILRIFAQTPDGRKRVREMVIRRLGG